jgi:hypothetical protein
MGKQPPNNACHIWITERSLRADRTFAMCKGILAALTRRAGGIFQHGIVLPCSLNARSGSGAVWRIPIRTTGRNESRSWKELPLRTRLTKLEETCSHNY